RREADRPPAPPLALDRALHRHGLDRPHRDRAPGRARAGSRAGPAGGGRRVLHDRGGGLPLRPSGPVCPLRLAPLRAGRHRLPLLRSPGLRRGLSPDAARRSAAQAAIASSLPCAAANAASRCSALIASPSAATTSIAV